MLQVSTCICWIPFKLWVDSFKFFKCQTKKKIEFIHRNLHKIQTQGVGREKAKKSCVCCFFVAVAAVNVIKTSKDPHFQMKFNERKIFNYSGLLFFSLCDFFVHFLHIQRINMVVIRCYISFLCYSVCIALLHPFPPNFKLFLVIKKRLKYFCAKIYCQEIEIESIR